MTTDQDLQIPPELDYITQACRAVSKANYGNAISLLKEGLRENSGIAEKLDIALFIALLRALVVELEIKFEELHGPLGD